MHFTCSHASNETIFIKLVNCNIGKIAVWRFLYKSLGNCKVGILAHSGVKTTAGSVTQVILQCSGIEQRIDVETVVVARFHFVNSGIVVITEKFASIQILLGGTVVDSVTIVTVTHKAPVVGIILLRRGACGNIGIIALVGINETSASFQVIPMNGFCLWTGSGHKRQSLCHSHTKKQR